MRQWVGGAIWRGGARRLDAELRRLGGIGRGQKCREGRLVQRRCVLLNVAIADRRLVGRRYAPKSWAMSLTADHTVLYDADCGFCKCMMAVALVCDRGKRVRPLAIQSGSGQQLLHGLPSVVQLASWHLVTPDGTRSSGGAAIPPLLGILPCGRLTRPVALRLPRALDHGYRWVARNRVALSRPIPAELKRRASRAVARVEVARDPAAQQSTGR
jgi:predicted DCC family thiol-disulfide oxidoreductase YuxK